MNSGSKPSDTSSKNPSVTGVVPFVNHVIVAARGATDPFIQSMKKFGDNNFKRSNRSTIRFRHDFGAGLRRSLGVGNSVEPGILQNVQAYFAEAIAKMVIAQKISSAQSILTRSVKSSIPLLKDPQNKHPIEKSIRELAKNLPESMSSLGFSKEANSKTVSAYETIASKSLPLEAPYGSRVEKVINGFLQTAVLDGENKAPNDIPHQNAEQRLQSENLLQMVMKHQQVIEKLVEENQKLKDIMVEDLKISPKKLQGSNSNRSTQSSTKCPENDTGYKNGSSSK